jgi:hypothetical protein
MGRVTSIFLAILIVGVGIAGFVWATTYQSSEADRIKRIGQGSALRMIRENIREPAYESQEDMARRFQAAQAASDKQWKEHERELEAFRPVNNALAIGKWVLLTVCVLVAIFILSRGGRRPATVRRVQAVEDEAT